MKKEMVANELVVIARLLAAAAEPEEDKEVVDETFTKKVRDLRQIMMTISKKKNMRLNKFGITVLRPNNTVSDLVDALLKVSQAQ